MSTVDRIDSIYEQMSEKPLSAILPQVLPIALECDDYVGYCILSEWNMPLGKEKNTNRVQREGILQALASCGFSEEKAQHIEKVAFEKYLSLRTIEKEHILASSAKEMEDTLKRCDELMVMTEPPKELHPVDLYFRSEKAQQEKMKILESRRPIEAQYALLQSFISNKLAVYRQQLVTKERKRELEQSIRHTKDVFIVHGHNEAKLLELEKMLKNEFQLNPIILKDKPNSGLTIIDKFEKYATSCSYAFALFTPDDIVENDSGEKYFQARPNVIFELGWFYANLGRNRVCILEQASEKSEIFSDLQGILRIQFNRDVEESFIKIKRELESVGII